MLVSVIIMWGRMQRREFIRLVGGAAVWPVAARAQQPANPVIGIALVATSTPVSEMNDRGMPLYVAFFDELVRLGYLEGKNLRVKRFSAGGDVARYSALVREIISTDPNVIVVSGNRLVLELKAQTNSIPVIGLLADPLASGLVTSLARPSGNITGITVDAGLEINGKRLATLLEAVPGVSRIGYLAPEYTSNSVEGRFVREIAQAKSVSLVGSLLKGVMQETEYRRVFETFASEQAQGIIVSAVPENFAQRRLIVELAGSKGLPAIYPYREYVDIGGLMAYSADLIDVYRRMAQYTDLILKGTRPGDLPIYQASKFNTIINLKCAKALGLDFPPTVLARADDVIE
jgi:putative tryptophan/tyrosine transport system substrate-binding protein